MRESVGGNRFSRLTNPRSLLINQTPPWAYVQFADSFAERSVTTKTGAMSTNAAAASGVSDHPAPTVSDVDKALDWWIAKAVETDAEMRHLSLERRRYEAG